MRRKRNFVLSIEYNRSGVKTYLVREVYSEIMLRALTSHVNKTKVLALLRKLTGRRLPKKIRFY